MAPPTLLQPTLYWPLSGAPGADKDTVLALNPLNARCNHSLTETDQRESLWELIIRVAATAGVDSGPDDITEEWPEW